MKKARALEIQIKNMIISLKSEYIDIHRLAASLNQSKKEVKILCDELEKLMISVADQP